MGIRMGGVTLTFIFSLTIRVRYVAGVPCSVAIHVNRSLWQYRYSKDLWTAVSDVLKNEKDELKNVKKSLHLDGRRYLVYGKKGVPHIEALWRALVNQIIQNHTIFIVKTE